MTETPVHDYCVIIAARREARALVRRGLRYCPTCHAAGSLPCRTRSGRVAREHKGRADLAAAPDLPTKLAHLEAAAEKLGGAA